MENQKSWHVWLVSMLVMLVIGGFYWSVQGNYFYMDDFQWVGRALTAQHSFSEIFTVVGRDFNPVFLFLLWVVIKIFGPSALVLRFLSLIIFSAVITAFFYILWSHFKIHPLIAVSAALCAAVNVFVSEAVLNIAALVYPLSLLLALLAAKFFWNEKKWYFLLFLTLAFLTKETALLILLPLFLYEQKKQQQLLLVCSGIGFVIIRVALQWGATSNYTSFVETTNAGYKFYFLLLRSLNLSPYGLPLSSGIIIIAVLLIISGYLLLSQKERAILFFLASYLGFALFFSLLPKLSSRYLLFPAIGFWGIAALLAHYFYSIKENKILRYALIPFLVWLMIYNYPLVQREIEDYKILGEFSKEFTQKEGNHLKGLITNQLSPQKSGTLEITIHKGNNRPLAELYEYVQARGNLPKLLPFREHSIGGVIEPPHLLPIIFYPQKITWQTISDDNQFFVGKVTLYQ